MNQLVKKIHKNKDGFRVDTITSSKYVKGVFIDNVIIDTEQGPLSDEIIEGLHHKESCFGKYMDKDGNFCEDGASGLCNYCVECRRVCIYI